MIETVQKTIQDYSKMQYNTENHKDCGYYRNHNAILFISLSTQSGNFWIHPRMLAP